MYVTYPLGFDKGLKSVMSKTEIRSKIIVTMLDIAARETSTEAQALSSFKKAVELCKLEYGIDISAIVNDALNKINSPANAELLEKIKLLEEEVALLKQTKATDDEYKAVNGKYSFQQLRSLVIKNNDWLVYGWQTALFEECKKTKFEINQQTIQKWRSDELSSGPQVPADFFEFVKTIKFSNNRTKVKLDKNENAILLAYYEEYEKSKKFSYAQIATQLSKKFNKHITENSIKGAFDRIRLSAYIKTHILKMKSEGNNLADDENIVSQLEIEMGRKVPLSIVRKIISEIENRKTKDE